MTKQQSPIPPFGRSVGRARESFSYLPNVVAEQVHPEPDLRGGMVLSRDEVIAQAGAAMSGIDPGVYATLERILNNLVH